MPLIPLVLHRDYTRREIHDVFEPESTFAPQRGTWGILGLIPLSDRPGDFVFLVTYGQSQGEHSFDEGISTEGVLRWQSQPRQTLNDKVILQLIAHDEDRHSIYLFLRGKERLAGSPMPYTYLGRLKYLEHDAEREQPVHFRWQLLDWPIPPEILTRMGLRIEGEVGLAPVVIPRSSLSGELIEEPAPTQKAEIGSRTRSFRAAKLRYQSEEEAGALGLAGELLVLEHEQRKLHEAGQSGLADRVRHTSAAEGDGAGYDIQSFFIDGRVKYIEVKTTTGPKTNDFFISANEVEFSSTHRDSYELCRVFEYDEASNSARCYSVLGDISQLFRLQPTNYKVSRLVS
jgi:hypothetical protein